MACLSGLDTVILAGGQGTRLRSVFADRPKVLVPVNGEPFLQYLLEQVRAFGGRRVILALGYLAEQVRGYVAARAWAPLEMTSVVETEPLGTGGALRSVLPLLRSETTLVMNGDSFVQADLCDFVAFHRQRRAAMSVVLTHAPKADRYGRVETDGDGLVTAYHEKEPSGADGGFINAGVYLIERSAIQEIPAGRAVSLERETFPAFCRRGWYAMRGTYPFIDIGTPESYARAEGFFEEMGLAR